MHPLHCNFTWILNILGRQWVAGLRIWCTLHTGNYVGLTIFCKKNMLNLLKKHEFSVRRKELAENFATAFLRTWNLLPQGAGKNGERQISNVVAGGVDLAKKLDVDPLRLFLSYEMAAIDVHQPHFGFPHFFSFSSIRHLGQNVAWGQRLPKNRKVFAKC